MDSPHPLKTWIDANSSQAEFARMIGCSDAYLSEILKGRKFASLKFAARASRATGGAVPLEAFVEPEKAE